jgi:hypothetical protein
MPSVVILRLAMIEVLKVYDQADLLTVDGQSSPNLDRLDVSLKESEHCQRHSFLS